MYRRALPRPRFKNQHFSVDPEGKEVFDLVFVSEALGMPAADGYGWAQFEFGEHIGQDNRYTITRKLGWGMHSSAWLARDNIYKRFVAVKALTGHATDLYERAVVWEPEALRLISRPPSSPHCTQLMDEFKIPGKGSAGSHMCFVMPVYGGDVKGLVEARTTALPLPLAKWIVLHLLRGIAHTHESRIVHTDLKHDNIFYSTSMTADGIGAWVTNEPSRRHAPEISHDGVVQAAVSQPLPMISEDEAMRATCSQQISAQPSGLHVNRPITTLPLRPPEVYLEAEWDKPADIWTFGCLIFELVTSKHLFRYVRNQKFGLDETENMLYQMMLHTEEEFRAEQLQVSPKAPEYFYPDCQLKKNPEIFNWPIKARIDERKVVSDEEAEATVRLIERCLRLDPEHRSTASELLSDPWFNGVD
ncbi:kinase-like protein [Rickenella mellea]|uniref:non-specific serine/threonine protein kinase n=1 Tax=Rickenella mellea TaxID=50990 RepID=A0A4Y7PXD0_9AGAM|nr:kinase-like protein [Rickenella mellea]